MAYTKLFGNRIVPACLYCESAIKNVTSDKMVLCSKKGVVPPYFSCRYYHYDPVKRVPKRPDAERFDKSDFEI